MSEESGGPALRAVPAVAEDGPSEEAVDVHFTLTREQPEGWTGYSRRIDRELLGAWIGRIPTVILTFRK